MAFIFRYARETWNELFGPIVHGPYKAHLRPRTGLKKPSWLPLTPTKSHRAPVARARTETDILSRKCPHCKGNIYVNLKSGRISKPVRTRKKNVSAPTRCIKFYRGYKEVDKKDEFLEEDLSPRMKMRSGGKVRHY